ncbi:hypothetical protein ACM46_15800 [Chryseobacterium angstadtii]|uniref:Uncharacterized protein n=1 Tax=Chryseobacterium angstadtii TaxID=558151 RepID=A0A0J7I6C7_9FLAO|nr:hypothetical protein ACM46_15800 [Chryseobacterium angstadtii]
MCFKTHKPIAMIIQYQKIITLKLPKLHPLSNLPTLKHSYPQTLKHTRRQNSITIILKFITALLIHFGYLYYKFKDHEQTI